MPVALDAVTRVLQGSPRIWLVTGVAGFIGSNLLERLLALGRGAEGRLDAGGAAAEQDTFTRFHRHYSSPVQCSICRLLKRAQVQGGRRSGD